MNRDPFTVLTLLGTQRMPAPPRSPHPVLDQAWNSLDWSTPENATLSGMALVSTAREAGAQAEPGEPEPDPAPPESVACTSPSATLCLRRMLAGEHSQFLPDWIELATRCHQRVAFRDLPAFLAQLIQQTTLLRPATAVLGDRGKWLAARTDALADKIETQAENAEAWETGNLLERAAWLIRQRQQNPADAANALAKTWAGASGPERDKFAGILATGPTAFDVPLLEQHALRDRRREVRESARAALIQLPKSDFAHRARTQVAKLVKFEGMLMTRRLVLQLPDAFEDSWRQDGIVEKPPTGTGPKAYWARQWISSVPLSFWAAHLDLPPDKLFTLNRDEESREVITLGWIDAAMAAPEATQAEAFAQYLVGLSRWPKAAPSFLSVLLRLTTVMDADAASRLLQTLEGKKAEGGLYFEFLFQSEFALSPAVGAEVLDRCVKALQAKPYPYLQSNHARDLSRRLPAAVVPAAIAKLSAITEPTSPTETLLHALEFRQHLHLAFQ